MIGGMTMPSRSAAARLRRYERAHDKGYVPSRLSGLTNILVPSAVDRCSKASASDLLPIRRSGSENGVLLHKASLAAPAAEDKVSVQAVVSGASSPHAQSWPCVLEGKLDALQLQVDSMSRQVVHFLSMLEASHSQSVQYVPHALSIEEVALVQSFIQDLIARRPSSAALAHGHSLCPRRVGSATSPPVEFNLATPVPSPRQARSDGLGQDHQSIIDDFFCRFADVENSQISSGDSTPVAERCKPAPPFFFGDANESNLQKFEFPVLPKFPLKVEKTRPLQVD
jgi:hypothetical protein